MKPLSLLVLCSITVAPVAAQTVAKNPADAAIDRAVAAYAKVKTARATFEQVLTNPLTGTTISARGEMQQRKPNQLAVRFTEPKGDLVIADGTWVWIYLPSTSPGQVLKVRMGKEGAGGMDFVGKLLESPRAKYTITDGGAATVGGRPTRMLLLVPRQQTQVTAASVWIDDADGTLRQFEVTEASGLVRRVRLLTLSLNVAIRKSAFAFTPPAGVKVLDQSAAMGGTR